MLCSLQNEIPPYHRDVERGFPRARSPFQSNDRREKHLKSILVRRTHCWHEREGERQRVRLLRKWGVEGFIFQLPSYRVGLNYHSQVVRMMQASSGRSGKQQQQQNSPKPGRSLLAEPCSGATTKFTIVFPASE